MDHSLPSIDSLWFTPLLSPHPKQCLNVSPLVAAIQSTQTLALRQSSAGFVVSFCSVCLPGDSSRWGSITGPASGSCENGYRDRLLAPVPFWDDEYIWYMAGPAQKSSLLSLTTLAGAASGYDSRATHLLSNLHLPFISVSPRRPPAFHPSFPFNPSFLLFRSSTCDLFNSPLPLHLVLTILFLLVSLGGNQQSFALLNDNGLLKLQPQFWNLFPHFLIFSTYLSVHLSAQSLFCHVTPVSDSIKCLYIVSFFLSVHVFLLCYPFFQSPSVARQSQGVNSSFFSSHWNFWKDELDWRLLHSAQSEFWGRQRWCRR